MTYWIVRKTHQGLGAAFEDEDRAKDLRDHWNELDDDDYEVVEREDPAQNEIDAGEQAGELDDLMRSFGL